MGTKKDMQGFCTQAVHAGYAPDSETGALVPDISQNVSFYFTSANDAAEKFSLSRPGFSYSRLTNPTVAALEKKLAALEGGAGATCTASGLAAHQMLLFALMNSGDEFVASSRLYGGTYNQFRNSFSRSFGWQCRFADLGDIDSFKRAVTEKSRAIFIESLSNPSGAIADIEAIARVAEEAGIPLIVDNTIATPYLCRPFDWGASIVTYSTTKYLNGHANAMGGAVIDSGKFDWSQNDKFPALSKPDESYHGLAFHKEFKEMALTYYCHAVGLRDLGACQQPLNAFLTFTGLETLGLRMEQHCKNALAVARHLEQHPDVAWVSYAGLDGSPYKPMADKYLNGRASGVFTFGVKGGFDTAVDLVGNVKLFRHVANIGDTRSLIIHSASTTHSQLTEEQQLKADVRPEGLRVSIGIEDAADLIADLDQALAAATQKAA
ncbi:MAG: O-acetylhomoserine aminocarboxypropyltransferase/cysteine synthase [Alphaproteobacteria bacterium]|nr:MAG: O-acetylhomoserine aminocarboxypropyltransferase/cysteine synthase [Alphaproteobacteria bacterium]